MHGQLKTTYIHIPKQCARVEKSYSIYIYIFIYIYIDEKRTVLSAMI